MKFLALNDPVTWGSVLKVVAGLGGIAVVVIILLAMLALAAAMNRPNG